MKTTIAMSRENVVNRTITSESYSTGPSEVYRVAKRTVSDRLTETVEISISVSEQAAGSEYTPQPKRSSNQGTPQLPLGI